MIGIAPGTEIQALEDRLTRGADLLFDMELRGDTGADYARWLEHYVDLLQQYEQLAGHEDSLAA
jgi:hypothetical protein